jgi:hypothetical protein
MKVTPKSISERPEINLRMGIKSSLPKTEETLGTLISLYLANDEESEIVYGEERNTHLQISAEIYSKMETYFTTQIANSGVQNLKEEVNKSPLYTAQLEPLQVALELIWKIGKISFTDSTLPESGERTGGIRHQKKIQFSANMLLIKQVLSDNSGIVEGAKNTLFDMITGSTLTGQGDKYREKLLLTLNIISEDTHYRLRNGTDEIVFQQESLYNEIVKGDTVVSTDERESVGPFRILKNIVGKQLHPFIRDQNGEFSLKADLDISSIKKYQKLVTTTLDLTQSRTVIEIDTPELELDPLIQTVEGFQALPKPFLLLAGISGTGKTRFITQQAKNSAIHFGLGESENYCLVPVRPDWHEPSDLLGYISRINGTKYICTDFLKFMVKAVVASVDSIQDEEIVWNDLSGVSPYWLCLDEMNLAPVEQYFADYLSILEMREWNEGSYSSKPMMQPNVFKQLAKSTAADGTNSLDVLWDELFEGVENDKKEDLSDLFQKSGIPLPPNLIVAGTVNMDETTHGFSRKVIDRALTIDFQEFFKNDYDTFFEDQIEPKLFTFPLRAQASRNDLPEIDADGEKSRSIEFLKLINQILINTPFELAYRALNELLLTVSCFSPYEGDEAELKLHAVWDDFLMQKVLPRIEGDSQKLRFVDEQGDVSRESKELKGKENIYGKGSVLHQLYALLETDQLADIWGDEEVPAKRPDLLRDTSIHMKCRSKKKLLWMMKRLKDNHFTDFWV